MALVGIELVQVPNVPQCPPHVFDDFHAVERRLQRLGGGVHGLHRRLTRRLGGGARLFARGPRDLTGFPQALPLLPNGLERLTMLVADLPRFFRQTPEPLRFVAVSLGNDTMQFSTHAASAYQTAPPRAVLKGTSIVKDDAEEGA